MHIMLVARLGFDSKDTYCGRVTLNSAKPTCTIEDCDCMNTVTCEECILLYFAEQASKQNNENYEPIFGRRVEE